MKSLLKTFAASSVGAISALAMREHLSVDWQWRQAAQTKSYFVCIGAMRKAVTLDRGASRYVAAVIVG
ncbi:MAG TPA: hypothetical protein VK638_35670 [Edaphobacter sp.]|nr:hypothetical protein [Edaphobacter sp.]